MNTATKRTLSTLALVTLVPALAWAQDAAELAKKLSNPVASLISVPLQFNYDQDIGSANGTRTIINVQPVIPSSLSPKWNLITRIITPIVFQSDVSGASGSQSGLGDMLPTFFFSPKAPTSAGIIWGVGPVFLLPTATDDLLGAKKFGTGASALMLKQSGPWTIGGLVNHIWSVAGDANRPDINSTFVQPFLTYNTKTATSFSVNSEATHDGNSGTWSVPINATISQIFRPGGQLISVGGGVRYWAQSPDSGPQGIAYRMMLTFLFPK